MDAKEQADILNDERLETFKSLSSLAALALRTLLLLNGGAVIALLAFLGNNWGKGSLPKIGTSISGFVAGLAFAGAATAGAYLTQLHLYGERRDKIEPPYWSSHQPKLHASIILCVISLGCFCYGAVKAVAAFNSHL